MKALILAMSAIFVVISSNAAAEARIAIEITAVTRSTPTPSTGALIPRALTLRVAGTASPARADSTILFATEGPTGRVNFALSPTGSVAYLSPTQVSEQWRTEVRVDRDARRIIAMVFLVSDRYLGNYDRDVRTLSAVQPNGFDSLPALLALVRGRGWTPSGFTYVGIEHL